jgi:adenylate cyclase
VKRLGDGPMAAFWSGPDAVEAALEAHQRIAPLQVEGYRPRLRTGIHLGRPRKVRGDYFGIDVNVAARLAEASRPGEILVSDRTPSGSTAPPSPSASATSAPRARARAWPRSLSPPADRSRTLANKRAR